MLLYGKTTFSKKDTIGVPEKMFPYIEQMQQNTYSKKDDTIAMRLFLIAKRNHAEKIKDARYQDAGNTLPTSKFFKKCKTPNQTFFPIKKVYITTGRLIMK